jgi:hypothetical protein
LLMNSAPLEYGFPVFWTSQPTASPADPAE